MTKGTTDYGRVALTATLGLLFGACGAEEWTGTIYPDRSNLTIYTSVGTFDSLESCRQACKSGLADREATADGGYECGLNCETSEYGIMICDRTER